MKYALCPACGEHVFLDRALWYPDRIPLLIHNGADVTTVLHLECAAAAIKQRRGRAA